MKVLMVGLGGAGQRLLRHFRDQLPAGAQFGAYRARNRPQLISRDLMTAASPGVVEEYGLQLFPTLDAGLAWKPDAVIIANPTSLHASTALAAINAGAHVLIEKPLSHDSAGLDRLEAAASASGKVAMVGYMLRFHPALRRARDIVDEGRLGAPLWARFEAGSYVPDWHPYEDYRELYAVRRELGGGVVLTESHEFDLVLWFFGAPRRVAALGGKHGGLEGDVEDTASILLDCGFPVHVNLCFAQRPPRRTMEIAFQRGLIEWKGGGGLRVYDAARRAWDEFEDDLERDDLFGGQVAHFLACVAGREKPRVDIPTARGSLEIAMRTLSELGN